MNASGPSAAEPTPYDPAAIEARWQARWRREPAPDDASARDDGFTVLEATSSGTTLDRARSAVIADALARARRGRGRAARHALAAQASGTSAFERLGCVAARRPAHEVDRAELARVQALFLDLVEAGLVYRAAAAEGGPRWFARVSAYADDPALPPRDLAIAGPGASAVPLPIVHGEHSGVVPLRKQDLPVAPPHGSDANERWLTTEATGEPLTVRTAHGPEPARRDSDALDPFFLACARGVGSPIDLCIVGGDDAQRCRLGARFMQRALRQLGSPAAREPFARVLVVGRVTSGAPVDVDGLQGLVAAHGADAVRVALLGVEPEAELAWSLDRVREARRALERVWALARRVPAVVEAQRGEGSLAVEPGDLARAVAAITERAEELASRAAAGPPSGRDVADLVSMLAPIAPHLAAQLGDDDSAGPPSGEEG